MGGQPSATPQTNVGVNPHLAPMQGGIAATSHQPLGLGNPQYQQVPQSGPFIPTLPYQQPLVGAGNVPLNTSTSYGQGNPQSQQAPQLGPFIPNLPYQQPLVEPGHVPLSATP